MTKSTESPNIIERIAIVESAICEACAKSGRARREVELVVVTKKCPPAVVREVWEAGLVVYGENRVQEARAKIPLLPPGARWHLIGHLQSNKVRLALPMFEMIHSVDTLELARTMDRIAGELGLFPKVLVQVNVSGEATKFGFSKTEVMQSFEDLLGLQRVEVHGLMTMAPYAEDPELARPHFAALRRLKERIEDKFAVRLPHLSMGMSGDFQVAIEEGATLVRIGSAIFSQPAAH